MDNNDNTVIPGSVYLVDIEEHVNLAHAGGDSEIVLSPTPSNDVNDPLNWSKKRKLVHVLCVYCYTLLVGIGETTLYSILQPIKDDTGIPLSTLNAGTGYLFLFLGWAALINGPLALAFGKRGMYLYSVVGSLLMNLWLPHITTEGQWLANKILTGCFTTPMESLCEVSITDIFFAHERGLYIGLYTLCLFGSHYIGPIIGGTATMHWFLYDAQGWHWVMYWSAIIQAVAFVVLLFFMEESNYVRATTEASEGRWVEGVITGNEKKGQEGSSSAVSAPSSPNGSVLAMTLTTERQLVGTPKTYLQRLAVFNKRYTSLRTLFTMMYRPLLLLRFPVVFWSGFRYGSCAVWYNVLNATASLILSSPPYNFPASSVGLTYFGPLVGIIISGVYTGWVGDIWALRAARRTGGFREPEQRLWLMVVSLLLVPASLILWGVGASKGISWGGLVVGMGMLSCSTGVGSALSIHYALDSYKDLSGEVMMAVMIVRDTLSFAIGYGITPWLNMGLKNTFISAAFVGLTITMTFLPVIKWGKSWRKASRHLYWHYVAANTSMGR